MIEEYLVYPLYLFYGTAFFAMGVSITSRDTRASQLKIARRLWLFALFAYTHALLEWYSLYLILHSASFPVALLQPVNLAKLVLVLLSFSVLLIFAVSILGVVFPERKKHLYLTVPTLVFLVFAATLYRNHGSPGFSFSVADLSIRNFIGFPGGVIAGLGLILYFRTVRHISQRGALNFVGAGVSLACYGVLAGLVPSGGGLPLLGGPIELYRGISALFILYFVMHALHIFDVERKQQIEERLSRFAQSEKLHSLGKLAFGIAHEINNPLGNVSINAELLKSDLQGTEQFPLYEKRLIAIERNLDRASKIAKELLYFSTSKETDFQSTDINEILKSTIELLGSRRNDYDISFRLMAAGTISAIPWKLEEVFLNVILNAMDAMPEGGRIDIASERRGDRALVRIIDDGPGISSDVLPNVLDPFFTTKAVGKGTGLGLSICFGIMEMHGGSIELSSPVGAGTVVELDFPIGAAGDA
ncbi:MAG: ATP-binding protein [Desulfuromonadales bacterium]|nr:ATP-binding protein [Desulfuromonadales bacterium]